MWSVFVGVVNLEEATTQKLDRKLLFEMSFDKNTNAGKCHLIKVIRKLKFLKCVRVL